MLIWTDESQPYSNERWRSVSDGLRKYYVALYIPNDPVCYCMPIKSDSEPNLMTQRDPRNTKYQIVIQTFRKRDGIKDCRIFARNYQRFIDRLDKVFPAGLP